MTADELKRRNAAIRAAWDDPLRRALARKRGILQRGGDPDGATKRDDPAAYAREWRKSEAGLRAYWARRPAILVGRKRISPALGGHEPPLPQR